MLLTSEAEARDYVASNCSHEAFSILETFASELREESHRQNLVATSTLDRLWLRHIADSAQLLGHVSRETGQWLDIGSGGGFPGLVVAIMRPNWNVTLVEPRKLRTQWLRHMIIRGSITNCRIEESNLERVASFPADVLSARAVASLPNLIALAARFSTKQTEWILPKGRSAAQDIAQLPAVIAKRFHVEQSMTDSEARIVVGRGAMGGDQ